MRRAHSDAKAQMAVERFPTRTRAIFFIDGEALEEYTDMLEQDSEQGLKSTSKVLKLRPLSREG